MISVGLLPPLIWANPRSLSLSTMTAQTSGDSLNLKSSFPVVSSSASCAFGTFLICIWSAPLGNPRLLYYQCFGRFAKRFLSFGTSCHINREIQRCCNGVYRKSRKLWPSQCNLATLSQCRLDTANHVDMSLRNNNLKRNEGRYPSKMSSAGPIVVHVSNLKFGLCCPKFYMFANEDSEVIRSVIDVTT